MHGGILDEGTGGVGAAVARPGGPLRLTDLLDDPRLPLHGVSPSSLSSYTLPVSADPLLIFYVDISRQKLLLIIAQLISSSQM